MQLGNAILKLKVELVEKLYLRQTNWRTTKQNHINMQKMQIDNDFVCCQDHYAQPLNLISRINIAALKLPLLFSASEMPLNHLNFPSKFSRLFAGIIYFTRIDCVIKSFGFGQWTLRLDKYFHNIGSWWSKAQLCSR